MPVNDTSTLGAIMITLYIAFCIFVFCLGYNLGKKHRDTQYTSARVRRR